MKITKKRLLKLGFEEEMNSWLQITPIEGYTIWMGISGSTATISQNGKGEIERLHFDGVIWYGSIEKWFEEKTGKKITLPRPKKRSLKKAVKSLKKMIDLNVGEIQNLMVNDKNLQERMQDIEQHIWMDKAINPTSAENAQVEKPIEFGCWVEVVRGDETTPIGEIGVFYYEGAETACFITQNAIKIHTPIGNIKRIKSPIE